MTPLQRRSEKSFLGWMTCFTGGREGEGGLPGCAVPSDITGLRSVVAVENPTTQRCTHLQAHICIWCATVTFIFDCKSFPQTQTVRGKVSCQQDSLVG